MICTTTRKGMECFFMSEKGCTFNGGTCHEIIEKCNGCEHIVVVNGKSFCRAFPDPSAKWAFGPCNLATHVERKVKEERKINPLKAAKREAKGKK
jgi:hypothetical protein